ncbi:MAG: T9SS type A sorting domain-containing protein [Bacteroidales bacterium]|nr:T9SS type A sorting domain-containing protein [Bacteroidales bacterium]
MKKILIFIAVIFISVNFISAQQVEREMVILEIGTGTWCQYCPGAAMGADDLIENGHNVAVVEYHGGDDYENSYSLSRISYYGITGYPTAKFDGILTVSGGNATQSMYSSYLPKYNQRKAILSSFTLAVEGTNSGLELYDVNITIEKVAEYTGDNLVLHAVLTESHIEEFWQGLPELNFVERLMIPNQFGTALDFSQNNIQEISLQFIKDMEWNYEHCELVLFIQNKNSKEILQAKKMNITEFVTTNQYDAALINISMLPDAICDGSLEPEVTIKNTGIDNLTSVEIEYKVNNGDNKVFAWSGNLDYLETTTVTLPQIAFSVELSNILTVATSNPNGNIDQYPANDTQTALIPEAEVTPSEIKLFLRTDINPEETTWEILNYNNEIVFSGGPYSQSGQVIQEVFSLYSSECYKFNLYDAGGDGLKTPGMAILYYGTNTYIAQWMGFESYKSIQFKTESGVGIEYLIDTESLNIFPNPFSKTTEVDFNLSEQQDVSLCVFNIIGEIVYKSDEGKIEAGNHKIKINRKNLIAGVYFLRISIGKKVVTQKFSIID